MKELQSILKWAILIIGGVGLIVFLGITFNKVYFNTSWEIDPKLAADFGSFVGGFVDTIFSLVGTLVVAYTFVMQFQQSNQTFEEKNKLTRNLDAIKYFNKMIDFHNTMLGQMSIEDENGKIIQGRRVFDVILCQYEKIGEYITGVVRNKYPATDYKPCWNGVEYENFFICIAYAILYFGNQEPKIDPKLADGLPQESDTYLKLVDWYRHATMKVEIRNVDKIKTAQKYKKALDECKEKDNVVYNFVSRPNRSLLSIYFRSLYDIIEFVDGNESFDDSDKNRLIHVFKSQLSDAELFIWYYHDLSQIKYTEWKEDFGDYIRRYQLLADIPFGLDYKY